MHYFRSKFVQENGEKQHFSTKTARILTLIKIFSFKCIIIYHFFINFAT